MTYYEDLQIGTRNCFGSYHVTREEALEFASKYDPQAFHLDDDAAAATHFGRLSCSGWHTAAMTMRMLVDNMDNVANTKSLGAAGIDLYFNQSHLPGSVAAVEAQSHPATELLDTRWHYDAQEVRTALDAYGVAGRAAYRQFQCLDFVFMALYGAGLALLLRRLTVGRWRWLALLPLAVALADLSENLMLAPLLGEAIRRISDEESVSSLFV